MIIRPPVDPTHSVFGKAPSTESARAETPLRDPAVVYEENAADLRISDFADDLLEGANAIAFHMFGDQRKRRKVYHLAATSKMPFFKLGSMICARRSVLMRWVADQEARSGRHER